LTFKIFSVIVTPPLKKYQWRGTLLKRRATLPHQSFCYNHYRKI